MGNMVDKKIRQGPCELKWMLMHITAIIMKFSWTLSVKHWALKNKNKEKLEITYKWKTFTSFLALLENLSTESFLVLWCVSWIQHAQCLFLRFSPKCSSESYMTISHNRRLRAVLISDKIYFFLLHAAFFNIAPFILVLYG